MCLVSLMYHNEISRTEVYLFNVRWHFRILAESTDSLLHVCTSFRLSACISALPARHISAKFDIEEFINVPREIPMY
jgi:hypothetical protein